MLDEPFDGVDARTQDTICDAMRDLRGRCKTLVVATHDLSRLGGAFDGTVHLQGGELVSPPDAAPCCLVAEKEAAWTG